MIHNATMELQVSPSRSPRRVRVNRGRFLAAFVLVALLLVAAQGFFALQTVATAILGLLLFLPLVLIAVLSVGRELLTPSLKELAFYFFAIIAAGAIWPGAQLAISTYKDAGFVALAAFMVFVFSLAVALSVLSAHLLAGTDGDN